MVRSGPKKKSETKMRLRLEADIISEHGYIGPTEMVQRLKERGIIASRMTVTKDLKKDLENVTDKEIKGYKDNILKKLEEGNRTMYSLSQSASDPEVRIKAWNAYNRSVKTQADVITKFEEAKLKIKSIERPIINISFGEPKAVDNKLLNKKSEPYFKSGDGQDTLNTEDDKE